MKSAAHLWLKAQAFARGYHIVPADEPERYHLYGSDRALVAADLSGYELQQFFGGTMSLGQIRSPRGGYLPPGGLPPVTTVDPRSARPRVTRRPDDLGTGHRRFGE